MTIIQTLISAVTGTVVWEGIKFAYPEVQKWLTDRRNARKIINDNIDPLLKSVDELMAKLYSLAKSDFTDFNRLYQNNSPASKLEILYTIYLFCAFYSRLAIIRQDSNFINLATYRRGRRFLSFMYAFEAKRNRIITKATQRTIGDCFIKQGGDGKKEVLTIIQFKAEIAAGNQLILESIKPLEDALIASRNIADRQRIYLLGIILQAFIDFFDSKHLIVRKRAIYSNKLARRTKNELRFRVFDEYLPFIKEPFRYYK